MHYRLVVLEIVPRHSLYEHDTISASDDDTHDI